jgi:hypothetical protein
VHLSDVHSHKRFRRLVGESAVGELVFIGTAAHSPPSTTRAVWSVGVRTVDEEGAARKQ